MKVLGIIPARGGSKGIPRKNLRLLEGKPLIEYTIQSAQTCVSLTDIVVSTEDEEIANLVRSRNCPVLRRPTELAGDDVPMLPVVQHVLGALEAAKESPFDYAVILQPTAPLRRPDDIDEAFNLLLRSNADSVVSVYREFAHHPARMYKIVDEKLVPYVPGKNLSLRQSLPPVYHPSGAIYFFRREVLNTEGTFVGTNTVPFIMPRERSISIDDEIDWQIVETILSRKHEKPSAGRTDRNYKHEKDVFAR